MSKTLIQTARNNGDLLAFFDFRGGNFTDQSGNGITLTVPGDAQLSREGLRVHSTAASFPLDMSGTQNFCAVALLHGGLDSPAAASRIIAELTTDYTGNTDGWVLYQNTILGRYYGAFKNVSTSSAYWAYTKRADAQFVSMHMDRRLSYEAVKPYERGILPSSTHVNGPTNDGSAFADSTVYVGNRSGGGDSTRFYGYIQALGIIDFSTNQWSATDQAVLYSEIRDRETL